MWKAILFPFLLLHCIRCNAQQIQNNYEGNWKTDSTNVMTRTKIGFMKYHFTSNKIILTLTVNSDSTISGTIGSAKFNAGKSFKNKGNVIQNGITYIIRCGVVGKIADTDISDAKRIELWLKPMQKQGLFFAEIRQIVGWDTFPMGEGMFYLIK